MFDGDVWSTVTALDSPSGDWMYRIGAPLVSVTFPPRIGDQWDEILTSSAMKPKTICNMCNR